MTHKERKDAMAGTTDELYMRRCIQLARNGARNAPPNPMVGAVVVGGGRIIGEGYHVRCGEGHAEVNALASVRAEDEPLLRGATIYVSLEPCAHYGKTPPCADLIVRRGLRRCVVGCVDPFARVQGRGIRRLRDAGVDVAVGVLEAECRALNSRFMTFDRLHRPYVTLKWAQTPDGFIGWRGQTPERPFVVSNRYTQMLCHRLRAEHEAIAVGRRTLEADRPSLTVRAWTGRDPLRVVLSRRAEGAPEGWLRFASIGALLAGLCERGVQSLLVEGGRETLQGFIDGGCWDEARVETGTRSFADTVGDAAAEGVAAPLLRGARLAGRKSFFGHEMATWLRVAEDGNTAAMHA